MTPSTLRLVTVSSCIILGSISAASQIRVDTFAGGAVPTGVSAQNVAFGLINGITRDPNGNLVFCDGSLNVIRRINADGTIQTIAGVGIPGYGGDGGPAAMAILNAPAFPKYDSGGNLYFADIDNFRIRRIDPSGVISTVAGTGIRGILGADSPANQAQVAIVMDLAIDKSGNVYIAEQNDDVLKGRWADIRRISPTGQIQNVLGCLACLGEADGTRATQAGFGFITALVMDRSGNLYLSDELHVLYVSSDGILHHFAGFGSASSTMGNGGPALNAPISAFTRLATDSSGNVYTEEQPGTVPGGNGNTGIIIRRIGPDGIINVIAGRRAVQKAPVPR